MPWNYFMLFNYHVTSENKRTRRKPLVLSSSIKARARRLTVNGLVELYCLYLGYFTKPSTKKYDIMTLLFFYKLVFKSKLTDSNIAGLFEMHRYYTDLLV